MCHRADILEFDVRDKDHAMTEEIGKVTISLNFTPQLGFITVVSDIYAIIVILIVLVITVILVTLVIIPITIVIIRSSLQLNI